VGDALLAVGLAAAGIRKPGKGGAASALPRKRAGKFGLAGARLAKQQQADRGSGRQDLLGDPAKPYVCEVIPRGDLAAPLRQQRAEQLPWLDRRGARKVPETEQEDPVPITLELFPERYLEGREFLILTKTFDVFTNPNTDVLLDRLDPDEVVVFGVATDVCDDAAIRGLLARGRKVTFVEDAARGLDEERAAICTAFWRENGVEFTTSEVISRTF